MTDIKDWLTGEKDYAAGMELLAKYCKNKFLVRSLSVGASNLPKLEYELKIIAGIPLSLIFTQKCSNKELLTSIEKKATQPKQNQQTKPKPKPLSNKSTLSSADKTIPTESPLLPDPIAQAKAYIKDLYIVVDKMHRKLYEVGESNDAKIVAKRYKILEKRKPVIQILYEIYQLKESYFKTGVIDERLTQLLPKTPKRKKPLITNH